MEVRVLFDRTTPANLGLMSRKRARITGACDLLFVHSLLFRRRDEPIDEPFADLVVLGCHLDRRLRVWRTHVADELCRRSLEERDAPAARCRSLTRLPLGRLCLRLRQCSQLHEGSGPRISIDFEIYAAPVCVSTGSGALVALMVKRPRCRCAQCFLVISCKRLITARRSPSLSRR